MPRLMPDYQKIQFKDAFIERYQKLTDFEKFKEYSLSFLTRCIRVNTLKMPVAELKKRLESDWMLTPVPWCPEGFTIENRHSDRRDIGNLLEHSLGYIYVQESASMIPPIVLEPQENEIILDMCASPGSKTTQIAQYMKNTGLLVANDNTIARMKPLTLNLQRCGAYNCITTMMDGQRFKRAGLMFDRILVDAPCSGTGTIRKSLKTLLIWNPGMIKRLSGIQKQLIATAFDILKPGGILVYSTCSLEPEENEEVVDYLLKRYQNASLKEISLNLAHSEPIIEFDGKTYSSDVKKCLRIWPQDNDSEGFFVAKIKKEQ